MSFITTENIIKKATTKDEQSLLGCCHNIIGHNCSEKDKYFFCSPLELTLPHVFGKLDSGQEFFIRKNAKDIVLIENASDIISRMKDLDSFIEQFFKLILKDNKSKYKFLGSYTIPDFEDPKNEGETEKISEQIRKKVNKRTQNYILHVGLELGDVGHYGIIIKHGPTIRVFDSMQFNGFGAYSDQFKKVASLVFEHDPSDIFVSIKPHRIECLQITGGFIDDYDSVFPEDIPKYFREAQSLDSQNHFCYMWAIWYTHLFLIGGDELLNKSLESMAKRSIHPTIVIKKYIWALLNSLYPSNDHLIGLFREALGKDIIDDKDASKVVDFFLIHFRYIVDDLNNTGPFIRLAVIDCNLNKVRNFLNTNECIEFSLEDVIYIYDNFCKDLGSQRKITES